MYGPGPGPGNFFQAMALLSAWSVGFLFFLVWVAVLLLLIRFLLIGTRAAKVYLRTHGEHDGVLPKRAEAAAAPTTATKPAPRPRKTP